MSCFPPVLTEAQARAAVNLPPATGTPDQYTPTVLLWIDAITEITDERFDGCAGDGTPRWASTAELPARVTRYAETVFRENWSVDVGAHSPSFGPDRFGTDPPVGPAWVISYRAEQWIPDLTKAGFA